MATASQTLKAGRVTLAELSAALTRAGAPSNADPMYWIDDPGQIAPNWAGELSISVELAAEIVRGHTEARAKFRYQLAAHEGAMAVRGQEREKVGRSAYAAEYEAEIKALRKTDHRLLGVPVPESDANGTFTFNGRPWLPDAGGVHPAIVLTAMDAAARARDEALARFDERFPDVPNLQDWLRTPEGRQFA